MAINHHAIMSISATFHHFRFLHQRLPPCIHHHLSLRLAIANAILLPPVAALPSAVATSTAAACQSWSCALPLPPANAVIHCPSSPPCMPIPPFKIGILLCACLMECLLKSPSILAVGADRGRLR
jgi:hypothetical protein